MVIPLPYTVSSKLNNQSISTCFLLPGQPEHPETGQGGRPLPSLPHPQDDQLHHGGNGLSPNPRQGQSLQGPLARSNRDIRRAVGPVTRHIRGAGGQGEQSRQNPDWKQNPSRTKHFWMYSC